MALLAALDSAPYLQIAHLLSLAQGTIHTHDVTRIHSEMQTVNKSIQPFHIGTQYHTSSKAYLIGYVVNVLR